MTCKKCAAQHDPDAPICPHCGASPRSAIGPGLRVAFPLALLVLVGAVLLIRSRGPSRKTGNPCHGGTSASAEPLVPAASAPRDPHQGDWELYRLSDVTGLHAVELARVHHHGNAAYAANETQPGRPHLHPPVGQVILESGANAYYNEAAKPLDDKQFEIVSHALFVYAGNGAPTADRARQSRRGCLVTDVLAGSNAEHGGLRRGDVFATIGGRAPDELDVCTQAVVLMNSAPRGQDLSIDVLRDGAAVPLVLTRPPAGRYGFQTMAAPVLP